MKREGVMAGLVPATHILSLHLIATSAGMTIT